MEKYLCSRSEPIGANPRPYYGFPSNKSVKNHIKEYQPGLYNCIGKVKKLKLKKRKYGLYDKKSTTHLVYFKVRKK